MNWSTFQTYNDSPERSFEILCNQLFENWNKREYNDKLASFSVVNGSGGDGGGCCKCKLIAGNSLFPYAKYAYLSEEFCLRQ